MSKKYNIIYADPPWKYGGGKGKNSQKWGNCLSSYPCMKVKGIAEIPVDLIADDNCALFLWVTWPQLQEGLLVMNAWGFTYKTCAFVWVKKYKNGNPYCGMGYWTRSGSEFCLLGFKGKMERKNTSVYQVIEYPVTKHSQKPNETQERIVSLMGDLPRIELFARNKIPGWDTWGNEIENDIALKES